LAESSLSTENGIYFYLWLNKSKNKLVNINELIPETVLRILRKEH